MKVDSTFLRSRVARRIFLLFLACAVLPILALALVSYRSVGGELESQRAERLAELTKSEVMAIAERLSSLDVELQILAGGIGNAGTGALPARDPTLDGVARGRFRGLLLETGAGGRRSVDGSPFEPPPVDESGSAHLAAGGALLAHLPRANRPARLFLGREITPGEAGGARLWGEIEPIYLWWGPELGNHLPPLTEMCLFEARGGAQLFCSEPGAAPFDQAVRESLAEGALGSFSWSRNGAEYVARYRTANLLGRLAHPGFTVVVSESRSRASEPLGDFRRSFPVVLLITLWVVLLLSVGQIRRQLVPLERLREGTHAIAGRDFTTRVEVASGDEFEDLADSFNTMAEQLGKQFGALSAHKDIVQGVLSALDTERIVATLLSRLDRVLPCTDVALTLVDRDRERAGRTFLGGDLDSPSPGVPVLLAPRDLTRLCEHRHHLEIDTGRELPSFLAGFPTDRSRALLLLPIFLDGRLAAVLAAGLAAPGEVAPIDLDHARQVADQVAVALANARLLQDLERLSWGTLTALARTIDAKSHWTLGHSERVARTAVELGRRLDLAEHELEALHRGGLLHDIGKIGVTAAILDKPAKLTDEEMQIMRSHVVIGARILEPIPQLADALPIVRQHHEWFNGKGYMEGLAGEEISFGARVLSVVDCYDALRSPRPYRPARDHEWVIGWLREGSGSQFDPRVVEAFFQLIADKEGAWPAAPPEAAAAAG